MWIGMDSLKYSAIIIIILTLHFDAAESDTRRQEITRALRRMENLLQVLKQRVQLKANDTVPANSEKNSQTAKTKEQVTKTPAVPTKKEGVDSTGCSSDSCPSYACTKKLTVDEKSALTPEIAKLGVFTKGCNTSFFFSDPKLAVSFENAWKMCCSLGMKLVTLETGPKLSCLAKLHKDKFRSERTCWTSGTFNKCTRKFWWCQDKLPVPDAPGILGMFTKEMLSSSHCMTIILRKDFKRNALSADPCPAKRNFICQPDEPVSTTTQNPLCERPFCPANCTKVENSPNANRFKKLEAGCGKQFIASNYQAKFMEAYTACCEQGMRLLSVETSDKRTCLLAHTKNIQLDKELWSSAYNEGCERNWWWCGSDTLMKGGQDALWEPGEPTNWHQDEHCAMFLTSLGRKFKLSDVPCSDNKFFVCESL